MGYHTASLWVLWLALGLSDAVDVRTGRIRNHGHYVCSTWGNHHFKTFDGDFYQFPGSCSYNLASDCGESYQEFSVHVHRSMVSGHPHIDKITVAIKDVIIQLKSSIVIVNGAIAKTPYYSFGILIHKNDAYFKLYTKTGLTLMWNKEDAVMLELDPKFNNRTCGLCGDYNGVPLYNEFVSGSIILNPIQFGNLQNIHDPNDECTDKDETQKTDTAQCSQFRSVCEQHLRHEAFSDCESLLNLENYIQACMLDMCSCDHSQDSFCLCSTITEYSRQCSHAGGRPGNWRTDNFCPKQCPANMIYQESASPCKNSCSHLEIHSLCEEHYMDGCFCPEGTVQDDYTNRGCVPVSQCHCKHRDTLYAPGETMENDCDECHCVAGKWSCTDRSCPGVCAIEGGAHFTTFDKKAYTFHGNCYYVLSKGNSNESHVILGELTPCSSSERETCLKSVVFLTDNKNNVVIIKADGTVLFNELKITLPHLTASFSVLQPFENYIILQAINGLKMQIQLSPTMQLYLTMEKFAKGQLQGLCGDFNSKEGDDFKTSGGLVEATASAFVNTWKAQASCHDISDWLEDPCSLSIENKNYAEYWCSNLEREESAFAKCHSTIDPTEYVKRCRYDSCNCKDSEHCMCAALSSYVRACAAKGIILWGWKKGICDKDIHSCPSTQVYLYNLTTCQPTCQSLAEGEKSCHTVFTPVDGCGCPDGQYLNEKDHCVDVAKCSCYYQGTYVQPLDVIYKHDERCSCHHGKLLCTTPVNETCPAGKVYFDCNKAYSGVSRSTVHRSCKTLGVEYFQTECISGCVCPNGLLDDGAGGCVPEDRCPCVHNEDIYPHGSKVKVDCNTCSCQRGRWTCTNAICYGTCIIYGNGHYITFDDKFYDFDGNCEFVAAQDYCGPNHSAGNFSIIIENIPCGTTGVTCSKSIKVFLGKTVLKLADKHIEETTGEGVKRVTYLTREVGIYMVIEASNGILLIWDRKTTIFIKVSPAYKGKLCGLCGNFDDNSQNDFKTSHMLQVNDVLEFGNSWKLDASCPEATEIINPCSKNPHRHSWSEKQCGLIKSQVFKVCHSKVDPIPFYEACVNDACSCDSGGDCECFCTAVAAYAQECTKAEACVYWRTPDICPIFCDYYNPEDECEWHYHPCGNHEIQTCRSINNVYTNVTITYLEGCYPSCPQDRPIFDESNRICVTKEDCGCYINNTHYDKDNPVPTTIPCTSCVCTSESKVECFYNQSACFCMINGTRYEEGEIISAEEQSGVCIERRCENGNVTVNVTVCTTTAPTTTSITTVTTTPTVSTTTVTTPVTTTSPPSTTCVLQEVCLWTEWFDVSKPKDDVGSGDYETYDEIRKHHKFCDVPEKIQCRAANAPDVSLDELNQVVYCNVSYGLICRNSEQSTGSSLWQKCFNYEISVYCCSIDCVHSTTPATTTFTTTTTTTTTSPTTTPPTTSPTTTPPSTTSPTTTPPTTTSPTTTPPTTMSPTTTPPTTTSPTTTTSTTPEPTSTSTKTTTTSPTTTSVTTTLPTTVTTTECTTEETEETTPTPTPTNPGPCDPDCKWSQWFDVSYPKYEPNGGDFETYENITNAGHEVCKEYETRNISCRAQKFPDMTLDQLGQTLTCDVSTGLICYNKDQTGFMPVCYNYEISVYCCRPLPEYCESTTSKTTTTTTTTTQSTTTKITTTTETLSPTTTAPTTTTTESTTPTTTETTTSVTTTPTTTTTESTTPTTTETTTTSETTTPTPTTTESTTSTTTETTTSVTTTPTTTTTESTTPTTTETTTTSETTTPTTTTTESTTSTTTETTTSVTTTPTTTTTESTTPTTTETTTTSETTTPTTTTTESTTTTKFTTTSDSASKHTEPTTPTPSVTTTKSTTTSPTTTSVTTTLPTTVTTTECTTEETEETTPTSRPSTVTPNCDPFCTWSQWFDVSTPKYEPNGGDFETYESIKNAGFEVCEGDMRPENISCRATKYPDKPIQQLGQMVTCDVSIGLICNNKDLIGYKPVCYNYEISVYCCRPLPDFCTTTTSTTTTSTTTSETTTTTSTSPTTTSETTTTTSTSPTTTSETTTTTSTSPTTTSETTTTPFITSTPEPPTPTITKTTTTTSVTTTSSPTTTTETTPTQSTSTSPTTTTSQSTNTPIITSTPEPSTPTITKTTTTTSVTTSSPTPNCDPVCKWSQWFDVSTPKYEPNGGDFETYKNIENAGFEVCEGDMRPENISCRATKYPDKPLHQLGQMVTCDVSIGLICNNNDLIGYKPVCYNYEISVYCCQPLPDFCTTTTYTTTATTTTNSETTTTSPTTTTPTTTTTSPTTTTSEWTTTSPTTTTSETTTTSPTTTSTATSTTSPTTTTSEWTTTSPTTTTSETTTTSPTTTTTATSTNSPTTHSSEWTTTSPTTTTSEITTPSPTTTTSEWTTTSPTTTTSETTTTSPTTTTTSTSTNSPTTHSSEWTTTSPTTTTSETTTPSPTTTTSEWTTTSPTTTTSETTTTSPTTTTTATSTNSPTTHSSEWTTTSPTTTTSETTTPSPTTTTSEWTTTSPTTTTSETTTTSPTTTTTATSTNSPTTHSSEWTTTSPTTTTSETTTPSPTTTTSEWTTTSPTTTTSETTTTSSTTTTSETTTTSPATTTSETTTTSVITSICVPDCKWSPWFDVSYPKYEPNGGDFETYKNITNAGLEVCEGDMRPEDISCRAQKFPDMTLDQLGQTLTCNVSTGLICYNKDQTGFMPVCYNYEISVYCCRPLPGFCTSPTTTTTTTTSDSASKNTEPTTPTPSVTTTKSTTTSPTTTSVTTTLPTPVTTTDIVTSITPNCDPSCTWSPWFDVSYPKYEPNGGDFETYENITNAGLEVCEGDMRPENISCRAQKFPDMTLDQLGQTLACDVSTGLICYNKDQTGFMPVCYNYEISVYCCRPLPEECFTTTSKTTTTTTSPTTTTSETTTTSPTTTTSETTTTSPTTTTSETTTPSSTTTTSETTTTSPTTTTSETTTTSPTTTTSETTTTSPTTTTSETTTPSPTTTTSETTTTSVITSTPEPPTPTTSTATTTPNCDPVCKWSQWFDVSTPKYEPNGGDYETYENIENAGFEVCEGDMKPENISCRATKYPDKPLYQLGQMVTCDVSIGLICYNKDLIGYKPVCYNYEISVYCCRPLPDYCPTTPYTTTSTTSPTTSETTTSRTPSPTTTTTETTTTSPTTTSETTTTSPTTTTSETTTTSPTTCDPVCKWSQWFDVSTPKYEPNGGDYETYENIENAGFEVCEGDMKPENISCRATKYPDKPLYQLGQMVTCDVSIGLICNNKDLIGYKPVCYNYEISVYCCRPLPDYCPTTPYTTTTTTTTTSPTTSETTTSRTPSPTTTTTETTTTSPTTTSETTTSRTPSPTTTTTETTTTSPTTTSETTTTSPTTTTSETTTSSPTTTTSETTTTSPTTTTSETTTLSPTTTTSETTTSSPTTTTSETTTTSPTTTTTESTTTSVITSTPESPTSTTSTATTTSVTASSTTPNCDPVCKWSQWFDVSTPKYEPNGGDYETYENIKNAGFEVCEGDMKPENISCRATKYPDKPLYQLGQMVTCDVSIGLICSNKDLIGYKPVCYNYEISVYCCRPLHDDCLTTTYATTTTTTTTSPTTSETTTSRTTSPTTTTTETTTTSPITTTSETTTTSPTTTTSETTTTSPTTTTSETTTTSPTTTTSETTTSSPTTTTSETTTTSPTTTTSETTTLSPTTTTSETTTSSPATTTTTESTTTSVIPSTPEPQTSTTLTATTTSVTTSSTTPNCDPVCKWSQWFDVSTPKYEPNGGDYETYENIENAGFEVCEGDMKPENISCRATKYPDKPLYQLGQMVTCDVSIGLICNNKDLIGYKPVCYNYEISVYCCRPLPDYCPTTPYTTTTTTTTTSPTTSETTTSRTPSPTTTTSETTTTSPTTTTSETTTSSPTTTTSETTTSSPTTTTSETTTSSPTTTTSVITTISPSTTTTTSTTTRTPTHSVEIRTPPLTTLSTPSNETLYEPTTISPTTTNFSTSSVTTPETTTTSQTTIMSSTPCVCLYHGTPYPPDQTITTGFINETCYEVICTKECVLRVNHWNCNSTSTPTQTTTTTPTTTSPSTPPQSSTIPPEIITNTTTTTSTPTQTSTTTPTTTSTTKSTTTTSMVMSTSKKPGCPFDPYREHNETWMLCNCTMARCLENNTVEIIELKCEPPPKITCANGLQPIAVPDEDLCCWHWECDCVCNGWGDPHYITFDGTYYSFQGNCTYTLVEEIEKKIDNFGVYIDNYDCGAQDRVSCPRDIIVQHESQIIRIKAKSLIPISLQVLINDEIVGLPYKKYGVKVYKSGINYVVEIPELETNITYNGLSFSVKLPYRLFGHNTQGQCGTCTNNKTDDCRLPNGTIISNCEIMADAWVVSDPRKPECSHLRPTVPPKVTVRPTPCKPSPLCDLLLEAPFKECHKTLSPNDFYKACQFDSCHVPNSNIECTSLQQYAFICGDQGVCVDWRSRAPECPLSCPSSKVYKACGPVLSQTCETTPKENAQIAANNRTVEGCFCPPGTILFSQAVDICVETCGCVGTDNIPRQFGEQFQHNCQDCICREGGIGITCQEHKCKEMNQVTCNLEGFYPEIQISPTDSCCNETVCKCDTKLCSTKSPNCKLGYEVVGSIPDGHCCPVYTCVRKNVCVHGNAEYLPGAPVFSDKCQSCVCAEDDHSPTGLEIKCTHVPCNVECPIGFELRPNTNDCCGVCEQTHCVINYGGSYKLMKPDTTLYAENDNCTVYSCVVLRKQFITSVSEISCPLFNEDLCEPDTIQLLPNGCCKICIEKTSGCHLQTSYDYLVYNNCRSENRVRMARCDGTCGTYSLYSAQAKAMSHKCTCCQEVQTSQKHVKLQCSDGSEVDHEYIDVEKCDCMNTDCGHEKTSADQTPVRVRRSVRRRGLNLH
ncbi:LOW QUALITY PROTEIN: mucin-2-like [Bufo gargarizans]|uniref:LOW QUALITY PROTEIN: mucin-2-like n=1 Tax=Bufo gargarizans TaxID=30331 RepID=UPI001CF49B01|nr:LOW QUALITY PROTEIN: mucin-2-like [Bufo gargarizans]